MDILDISKLAPYTIDFLKNLSETSLYILRTTLNTHMRQLKRQGLLEEVIVPIVNAPVYRLTERGIKLRKMLKELDKL